MTKETDNRLTQETGQTMTEYSVVLGLIVLVTVLAFSALGDSVERAVLAAKGLLP